MCTGEQATTARILQAKGLSCFLGKQVLGVQSERENTASIFLIFFLKAWVTSTLL